MKKKLGMALLVVSLIFAASACGGTNKPSTSSNVIEEKDIFEVLTDLNSVKEIHTEEQLAYLNYDGEYVTMPEDKYPDGKRHISEPNPVNLEWEFNEPKGDIASYSVIFGQEADLSDGYEVEGTTETSIDLYNVYLGVNYFQIKANYEDGTSDLSKIKTFEVENNGPRNLKIDGMTNCRDMGGRVLYNGATLRQGMIFRTSGTNGWGNGNAVVPDNVTTAGKKEMFEHLGIQTEVNVNSSGSNVIGVKNYVGAYMDYDGGKHHLFRNGESIKLLFHTLANPDNYPLFYHCRIGTDRTGVCGILINGLLGVDKNEMYRDYLFSNFGNIQTKRYIGEKAGEDNILKYIADIEKMPGETYQEQTYNMLLSIGVPYDELDSVIDILTDNDTGYDNDQGQILAQGKVLTPNGCNTSTTKLTDRSHPETYYVLDSNTDSVSYSFSLDYDYDAKIYAYLGNTEASTSKNINQTIKVQIDGNDVPVVSQTFKEAGFGTCGSRMNYASVNIANLALAKGDHRIVVSQIGNKVNIGGLTIFNA